MNKLYLLSLAIILSLSNFVYSQESFSFTKIAGSWKGTLEYADYKSDKRVIMKTTVVIKSSNDGESAKMKFVYDDFGKVFRSTTVHSINRINREYNLDGDKFSYIDSNGKVILNGSGKENGKTEPYRITIRFDEDSLSILKETRNPFTFRNQYKFRRVKNPAQPLRTLTVRELKEDFSIMKKALNAVHPGLYRYNSRADIERKLKTLEAKLNQPLGEGEFFKLISQFLAELKCYHTRTNPFNQRKEIQNRLFDRANHLPFYFRIIENKMLVTKNASSQKLSIGSEITKINNVPVKRILKNLLTATFADGNSGTATRLGSLELGDSNATTYATFDLMFPLFYPPKDGIFNIEAVDFKTKRLLNFAVPAMMKKDRTDEIEKRYGKRLSYDDGWKFEILKNRTAYLQISNFIIWKLSFNYKEFLVKTFAKIKSNNIKNLIIDIRGNGGGDSDAPIEILRYISQKELPCESSTKTYIRSAKIDSGLFKYFETYDKQIETALKNGVPKSFYRKSGDGLLEFLYKPQGECKPRKPFENNFSGNTYLLVNSANSSASFTMASLAKKNKLATLVGETTGGNKLGFNGGSYLFTYLPNSSFEFDIPIFGYYSGGDQNDEGISPDVFSQQKPEDIGNDFDRELELVKSLIRKRSLTQK